MPSLTQDRRSQSTTRSMRSSLSFVSKPTQQSRAQSYVKPAPPPARPVTVSRSTNEITKAQEVRIRTLQELAFTLHQQGQNPLITAINEVIRVNGSENFAGGNAYVEIERWLEEFIKMRGGKVPSRAGWMMDLKR